LPIDPASWGVAFAGLALLKNKVKMVINMKKDHGKKLKTSFNANFKLAFGIRDVLVVGAGPVRRNTPVSRR
jgi:hypothetical protein